MKKIYLITMVCLLAVFGAQAQPILQESFEGSFPPAGWTLINNGSGNAWTQNTSATYSYHGTRSMLYGYNLSNAADAWAITPALNISTAPVTVTFWVRVRSATYPEALKLTVGTGTTVADQSTILLDSNNLTNTVFQQWSVQWTPPSAGTYYFGFNCYSAANMWNVYVDSLTISTVLPGCSGAVTGGTTFGPTAGVCPNSAISLGVNGSSGGSSGFTYQWDSSSNGTTWYAIPGATNPTYSTIGTTSTYFRRNITCTNSSTTDVSSPLLVSINPVILCPCSPNNGTTLHSGTSPGITNIDLQPAGYTFAHTTIPTNGYTLANDTINYPTLSQTLTYTLTNTYSSSPQQAAVWIDWNQDGIFDATTEYTLLSTSTTSTGSVDQITVPASAAIGFTIMRIRCRGASFAATDACGTFFSGETVDVIIKVVAGTQCSGTPLGGITGISVLSICPQNAFSVNVTGDTRGVVGLTYQWESSTDSITWNAITGATNANYTETSGVTVATYYRRQIACSGGQPVYSTPIKISLKPSLLCICNPNSGTTLHSFTSPSVDSVVFDGNKLLGVHSVPNNGYTQATSTVTVTQGVSYPLYTKYSASSISGVWIDWNQDGVLDATEYTALAQSASTNSTSISVPSTSLVGTTLMRIRVGGTFSGLNSNDACSTLTSGETVDFIITIIAGTSCSGAPLGGITVATATSVCPNVGINLQVQGATSNQTGLSYQWQISTDSINWSDISGETNLTLNYSSGISTKTYFRRMIDCSGFQDFSTPVAININPLYLCPCAPPSVNLHTSTSPYIDSVFIAPNYSIAKSSRPSNGYTFFSTTTNTPKFSVGQPATVFQKNSAAPNTAAIWIDWNQDGIFGDQTSGEYYSVSNTTTASTTITPPANALLGLTVMRMRIRAANFTDTMACASFGSGETVDFVVNVLPQPTCLPPSNFLVSNITSSGAAIAFSPSSAATYNVYYGSNPTTPTNSLLGVSGSNFTLSNLQPSTKYYVFVSGVCSSNDTSTFNFVNFTTACGTYNTPVTESFENLPAAPGTGILPTCWTTVASPATSSFATFSALRNNMKARTGSNIVASRWSSTSWLVTPPVNLTAGTAYNFIYYYRPSDPIAGYTVNNFVANQGDTLSLAAGTALGSFVDPTDTTKWTAVSYTFTPTTNGVYYFGVQSSCPTFSPWYLYFDDFYVGTSGLPVNLVSFDGKRTNKVNQLTWKTATEINNKGFEVQRSLDGKSFETIGFIASKANNGNSNFGLEYSFVDNKSPNVTSYYRLKQVDHNGKFAISKVVTLKADKVQQVELVSIYPNPTKDKIKIVINSPVAQKVTVVISDVVGKVVLEKTLQLNAEGTVADINIQQLQASNYFIKVVCNSGCETTTQKFVKQ